jgi:hypothetical protein
LREKVGAMSGAVAEQTAAPLAPPKRPGWLRVVWATFLGYVLAGFTLFGLLTLAWAVGVGVWGGDDTVARGIFHRYDAWSWAAEACAGLLATGVTASMVDWRLRAQTGWEAPFWLVFLVLMAAGYVPGLALTPLYGATGLASLLVASVVLWRVARPSGAEPMGPLTAVPRSHRRAVVIALGAITASMAAYVVGYAATHPIDMTTPELSDEAGGDRVREYRHRPGSLVRYTMNLFSEDRATPRDVRVVGIEGSPVWQLERTGIEASTWELGEQRPLRPVRGIDLTNPDGNDLTLELRQGATCPTPVAKLNALVLEYRLFGRTWRQRLPLSVPPAVRC